MKTLGRFVLIDNTNKKQIFLQWKTNAMLNRTLNNRPTLPMSYQSRKTLISGLKPIDSRQKLSTNVRSSNKQIRNSGSIQNLAPFFYMNPQRQNTQQQKNEGKTFYRTRSLGKISKITKSNSTSSDQKNKLNVQKLRQTITEADRRKGRAICILKMRKDGLRYNIKHSFFAMHKDICHEQFIKEVKNEMFEQFRSLNQKKVYLFHLGKEPINNIRTGLNPKEYVIFADIYPKFDIPFEMQMKLFEQASIIQQQIKVNSLQLEALKDQYNIQDNQKPLAEDKQVYQWQKIKDIKKYVDLLVDNPLQVKRNNLQKIQKDDVQVWYEQKFSTQQPKELKKQKRNQKNPFFDLQSHFPKQTSQLDMLEQAANRVSTLAYTINKHQIKQRPVQNMMQKIKRQNENADQIKKIEGQRIKMVGYKSQKDFLRQLDGKNIPLSSQNIPYMMQKYGITRAQAYNLYNIYKSLEKISAMRLFKNNQYVRVKQKGIDRKTFDEGLQGLQINPGDQVIRNICYFPQFISWEEFIKIISISMRKTPKSKLEAILQGLGSKDQNYLRQDQIDIMVGSSIQKIFGKDEPELRKYFVSVVMKQLDKDKSGTIEITQLKEHVLEKGIQNLDLVSYLMLNS